MISHSIKQLSCKKRAKGAGIFNTLISNLPFEAHLPGYQYCGPGTKLTKRLNRGDPGINKLDQACKEHDIAYSKFKETDDRHIADKILVNKAWQRVKSGDASFGERANALLVTNLMKTKVKLGMGLKRKCGKSVKLGKCLKRKPKKGQGLKKKKLSVQTFGAAVRHARAVLKQNKPTNLKDSIKVALTAAKKFVKTKKIKTPRIIPVPKVGGILPFLIPLFAGLSAVGALTGGAAGVAKAVIKANEAKKQLSENKRHNETMEAIAMGRGLYLSPYRKGLGLYLRPDQQSKNF